MKTLNELNETKRALLNKLSESLNNNEQAYLQYKISCELNKVDALLLDLNK